MGFEMFHYLLSVLWQSSLLFTGFFLLLYLLRKRGVALRHKILLFALLLSPFLPLLTLGIQKTGAPQQGIMVMPPYTEPFPVPANYFKQNQTLSTESPVIIDTEVIQPATPNPQSAPFSPHQYPWAFSMIIYIMGLTFFLCWIIMGRLRIRHWRLESVPCTDERVLEIFHKARKILGLERNILILESRHVPAPLSLGTIHPAIFIPENLQSHIDDEELAAIAFHETAHIKRRDPLILNLAALVRAILFFHPLVWMAVRQISNYAEMCADDAALKQTGQPFSYARLLTRLSENLSRRPLATEMATGLLFTKSAFLRRVEAILGDRPRLRRLSRFSLIASLMAILVSLFLSLSFPLRVGGFAQETKREWKNSPETIRIAHWTAIVNSQTIKDLSAFSPGVTGKDQNYKSLIVPNYEMGKCFINSQQNGKLIFSKDVIDWLIMSKQNLGWDLSCLLPGQKQFRATGEGQFDAKIKKNGILFSLKMDMDLQNGDFQKKFHMTSESSLEPGNALVLFFPINGRKDSLYQILIFEPEQFLPEEIPFVSQVTETAWWLEEGREAVARLFEYSKINVKLKTDLSDGEFQIWNKPLAHYDLTQNRKDKLPVIDLGRLDQDLWLAASEERLARNPSLKDAFDKGDLCVPELHLLLPLRRTRMAPLITPGRIRSHEPLSERLKRMTKSEILDQISVYEKLPGKKAEGSFAAWTGLHYALVGNEGHLAAVEIFGSADNPSAGFIPLGKINEAPKTAEIFQGRDMSLQGSVIDEHDNPLEGVKIVNWFPFGSNPQETWTDSRGTYYFKTRMGYVVRAYKEGYAPAFEEFRDKYNRVDEKKEPMFANITMNKGGIVEGRILDKTSGKPLEGAWVLVDRKARDPHVGNLPYDIWTSERTTTDNDGRFRVELVPTGMVKIRAEADGYKSEESGYLDLEKGKTKSFEISLEKMTPREIREKIIEKEKQEKRDRSLNGAVKNSSGNPLDGVKISNFFPNGSMPQETFTNARGEFRFEKERGYVVIAEKNGYAPAFYEFRDRYSTNQREGKDPFPVEMVMTKGGRVSGVIRSEKDNNPIPGANVWLDRWGNDPDVGINRYIIWKSQSVKTDEQGRFQMENAPDGTLRLHAQAEGFAENISPEFAVDPESGKEISLDLYQGMDVRILVLDKEKETSVEGVDIWFSEKGSLTSDQDGVCLFPNVSLGKYWIRCKAESYHELTVKDIAVEEKQGLKEVRLLMLPVRQP
jgi:beta-lactamase regulating signal transducer with metallopeptidase domain/protocatechuate 3,4-dioxygenase beta subunit